jgi:hypothetical protein
MPLEASSAPVQPGQTAPFDPSGPGFEAAHRRLLGHHDLQFDFTPYVPPKPPSTRSPPGWLTALAHLFKLAAPVLEVIFWIGVAAAVLLILYLVARELGFIRWGARRNFGRADFQYQPDADVARTLLADADALAAEGRFAEAVHVLLQRSIEDMRARRPRAVAPSLTSRDIAVLPALPETVRPAFAAMARVVEHSLFGGRPVAPSDFAAARQSYEAFAFPGAWS